MSNYSYVSGRLGKALVVLNGHRVIIDDSDAAPREPNRADLNQLFSENAEVLPFQPDSLQTARSKLNEEILFQDALFLFLSCCDSDLPLSTRIMCAQELEPILENQALARRLNYRLICKPMPLATRAKRHETVTLFSSFDVLAKSLSHVFRLQEWCDEVAAAWQDAAKTLHPAKAAELEAELIEDETFAAIVEAASTGELHRFNAELISMSLRNRDPEISSAAKEALLRTGEILRSRLRPRLREQRQIAHKQRRHRHPPQNPDRISAAMQKAGEQEPQFKLSSVEAKSSVDKQLDGISDALFKGRDDLAERFIADLVAFQLTNSEKEHLAKSLCNLAAVSLDANNLEMADRLSNHALSIGVNDPTVYTTRAEVLKNLGSFGAALQAFKEVALQFPGSDYAWVGIADVLNEMGKHDESLASYDEAQTRFPDSPVAFNGYVTVLRSQGRRGDAIKYAVKVVQRFPGDPVSRATLAAALRDRGKYAEAIRQYKASDELSAGKDVHTILGLATALSLTSPGNRGALALLNEKLRLMPGSTSLLNAKANYLRRIGAFAESLNTIETIVRDFPSYTPAHFNRAATLIAMGKIDEARETLPDLGTLRSELDWSSARVRSVSLAAEGRFQEALKELEFIVASCPWRRELSRARTTLGYVQFKLGKSDESIKTLQTNLSTVPEATKQIRLILLGGAQLVGGNLAVANTVLHNLVGTKNELLNPVRENYLSLITRVNREVFQFPNPAEIQMVLAA